MTEEQEMEFLQKMEDLRAEVENQSIELADLRQDVRQCESGQDSADACIEDILNSNSRAGEVANRVETALLDISGINLAARLDETARELLRTGYTPSTLPRPSYLTNEEIQENNHLTGYNPSTQHPYPTLTDRAVNFWSPRATMSPDDLPSDNGNG